MTLRSLEASVRPGDVQEVLVIDNGSSDETASVVENFRLPGASVRRVYLPEPGVARARNAALAHAQGDLLVFFDDDLRFRPNSVRAMKDRLVSGLDACGGRIRIPEDLQRDWMTATDRSMIGSTEIVEQAGSYFMNGANMGFHRHVLDLVPKFDVELGAGALGSCEESLFADQLHAAGYSIGFCEDCCVDHHCSPLLLQRSSLLRRGFLQGRSIAYVKYHWSHDESDVPASSLAIMTAKAALAQLSSWLPLKKEGITTKEVNRAVALGYQRQLIIERKRPRNYDKFGLKKLR